MTARKPCFECNDNEQDNMSIGECLESPLCTSVDGPCCFMIRGGHWETCTFGARSEEYPAFLAKQNMTQCPCCKGSGFIPKEGSVIDDIRALDTLSYGDREYVCPVCGNKKSQGHAVGCELAAILRRLK